MRRQDRALISAVHSGSVDAVNALLAGLGDDGADPNAAWILPPLSIAADAGRADICRHLVNAGASLRALDPEGMGALHWAAQGSPEACQALLEAGADPDLQSAAGSRPAHFAARMAQAEAIEALGAAGANLSLADGRGDTPLHICASDGMEACVEALARMGADPNARDAEGRTPLHVARASCAAALLSAGTDPTALDKSGLSAMDALTGQSRLDAEKWLVERKPAALPLKAGSGLSMG
jgi:ankyrin repeat protein